MVRSGQAKVASGTSRSSQWAASELPTSKDLDPYPATDAPTPTTPPTAKSQLGSDDAINAIHHAARGYPRAVNNLAVAALIATYAADKAIVDLAAAQSAITENSE